ncbi:MAG: efflux RND transporter periplasmic adaptor subunit [Myxococcales bacterium]|nr:efflux RND transporter periplasmic adaptor subunit [Myxococcales bacterium]MCB9641559.1 efflux RND transporter periplasmic adaptor subunit [Myxococcales bacterium]
MKRLKTWLFWIAALALIGVLIWQWRKPDPKKAKRGRRGGAVVVEVTNVKRGEIVDEGQYIGSLLPRYQYTVSPQIGGRLNLLKVRVGDKVKPNDLLATIENNEVVQQVEQALAEVRVANAQLEEQKSRLSKAYKDYQRTRTLSQRKLVSQTDREAAESAYKIEAAKLKVAQASLSQKRSLLRSARVRLSYTRITAQWVRRPLSQARRRELMEAGETIEAQEESNDKAKNGKAKNTKKNGKNGKKTKAKKTKAKKNGKNGKTKNGKAKNTKKNGKNGKAKNGKAAPAKEAEQETFRMVGERLVDEGSLVQPNAPMLTLLDIRSVIAVIYVTEKDYIRLRVGQPAYATTYVYKNRTFAGKVVRIAPMLKESSRLARVEIEIHNEDLALKPGMFVRLRVEYARYPKATLIPRIALVQRDDKSGVFHVDPKKKVASFLPLKLGVQTVSTVQVLTPLAGQVVTLGYHLLRNGSKIQIGSKDAKKGKKGKGGKKGKKGKGKRKNGKDRRKQGG